MDWDSSFEAAAALRTCSEACLEASAASPDSSAVACAHGKLLRIPLEFPRGIQHPLDNAADLGSKIFDKLIELRLATIHRKLFSAAALRLYLAELEAVVLEDADGPGDSADFVAAICVLNLDVGLAFSENSQGFRHSAAR